MVSFALPQGVFFWLQSVRCPLIVRKIAYLVPLWYKVAVFRSSPSAQVVLGGVPGPSQRMVDEYHSEVVGFIWSIADLIRDTFKRSKYQDVILPLTVLRRIDGVLAPTKPQVLATHEAQGPLTTFIPTLPSFRTGVLQHVPLPSSRCLPTRLSGRKPARVHRRFSDNMREVLEKFDFHNTMAKLDDAGLLSW